MILYVYYPFLHVHSIYMRREHAIFDYHKSDLVLFRYFPGNLWKAKDYIIIVRPGVDPYKKSLKKTTLCENDRETSSERASRIYMYAVPIGTPHKSSN